MSESRLTRYRAAVLESVRASHSHPTAADLYRRVHRRCPKVAYATIYNALGWLVRQGLIAEMKSAGAASRYDPVTQRHDHLVCTQCGSLFDDTLELPWEILAQAGQRHDFRVEGYRLEMFGLCVRCSANHNRRPVR